MGFVLIVAWEGAQIFGRDPRPVASGSFPIELRWCELVAVRSYRWWLPNKWPRSRSRWRGQMLLLSLVGRGGGGGMRAAATAVASSFPGRPWQAGSKGGKVGSTASSFSRLSSRVLSRGAQVFWPCLSWLPWRWRGKRVPVPVVSGRLQRSISHVAYRWQQLSSRQTYRLKGIRFVAASALCVGVSSVVLQVVCPRWRRYRSATEPHRQSGGGGG
jgi:hypothetical protein